MKNKKKIKYPWTICPICKSGMFVGTVGEDKKIVAVCENKKCESVLVYGKPIRKIFIDAINEEGM